jgi:hypothetical protein
MPQNTCPQLNVATTSSAHGHAALFTAQTKEAAL